MDDSHLSATGPLPYVTAAVPGIGGALKTKPEDFCVEEIPAYEPCGTGEHLFLRIVKRDVSAEQLVSHLARTLQVRRTDIGVAGLKDRRAVTKQYVSVPATAADRVAQVDSEQIQVLAAVRHANKLRTGHLKGNRFDILIRNPAVGYEAQAKQTLDLLEQIGVPNYFGPQRFGNDGETMDLGFDLLCGRRTPQDIPRSRRKFLTRLALSAAQSALFNVVVAEHVSAGTLGQVEHGDVMQVVASGGCFIAEDVAREQARYDRRETVLTGPLFGPKMLNPQATAAEREETVLRRFALARDHFRQFPKLTSGARRAAVVWPDDLTAEFTTDGLRLRFSLPSGSYATMVAREFMKPE